jgi:hypothetical protein
MRTRSSFPSLAAWALVAPLWLLASVSAADTQIYLTLESPSEDSVIGDPLGFAFISGRAVASSESFEFLDVMIVLDQSGSTGVPSARDVNGDGRVEEWCEERSSRTRWFFKLLSRCRPSSDSVLAAELAAIRTLMHQLDSRSTRLGLATFSGDAQEATPDSRILVLPTSDYGKLEQALGAVGSQGPLRWTNLAAGIDAGTRALQRARQDARSTTGSRRGLIVLFSDGLPQMPAERKKNQLPPRTREQRQKLRQVSPRDVARERRRAIEAATQAKALSISMDVYGLGIEPAREPLLVQLAASSSGTFRSVAHPDDLPRVFAQVDFSRVEELRIRNLTNGSDAEYALRNADGTFSALLLMAEGTNEIEVYARAEDGIERSVQRSVHFARNAEPPSLDPHEVAERTRLLAERLNNLQQRTSSIQADRDERLRRELELRIQGQTHEQAGDRKLRVEPKD